MKEKPEYPHTKACTNCGNPFYFKLTNRCRCIQWEVGKIKEVVS